MEENKLKDLTLIEAITKTMYFALTIFSQVGYGDQVPMNPHEMLFISFIMLSGVFFYSFIMSQLLDIILNFKSKMGIIDKS